MTYIKRQLTSRILDSLQRNPVTAIIGARQVGKSTLAKKLIAQHRQAVYLDLEHPADRIKLSSPHDFFYLHKDKWICLDEIQLRPDLLSVIRAVVDDATFQGRFLLLGSASPKILQHTAQTLAGRIAYFELPPLLWPEIEKNYELQTYFLRGGFPRALLAETDEYAFEWLNNFITTFLERDLRSFGFNLPSETLYRLWRMIAHIHGQIINFSQLGNSLDISHNTIRHYIEILKNTFMLRILYPHYINTKKRITKRPKIYIRDWGVLHALHRIHSFEELYTHPIYGSSWESLVIENLIARYPQWEPSFYRDQQGVEADLILQKAQQKIVIEIKSSSAPKPTKNFWKALEILQPSKAFIIAPVKEAFPLKEKVWVYPLQEFLQLSLNGNNGG